MIKISLFIYLILYSFTFGCAPSLEYRSLEARRVSDTSSPPGKETIEKLNHLTTLLEKDLEKDIPANEAEFSIPEEIKMDVPKKTISSNMHEHAWYLQALASTNFDSAKEIMNKFANEGFEVAEQKALINGHTYLRILIGPFKSKSEATEKIHKVKATGITKEVPFPRFLTLH
jgi:cell division protein FtsN